MLIKQPLRGAIYDRFNVPLAINKAQYNAAVCYAQIRDIPRIQWVKKQKVYARKNYITELATLLAKELDLDPVDVEDRIHSRAALFPTTPYVIAENISEKTHARLKMQMRNYPGLVAQIAAKRTYPQKLVCSDVIGYMGAIAERHYLSISEKLSCLEDFLHQRQEGLPVCLPRGFSSVKDVKREYETLKNQAYTINAMAGKAGIEKVYDHLLHGTCATNLLKSMC